MQLKYGSYAHDADSVELSSTRCVPELTADGVQFGAKEGWSLKGFLQAADQNALDVAWATLRNAYATDYLDVAWYLNDGSKSASLWMPGRSRIGGVRVLMAPSLVNATHGAYSTYLEYELQLEGTYTRPGFGAGSGSGQLTLLDWHESLETWGGFPQFVILESINGPPQKQTTKLQTAFHGAQSGEATGLETWPEPPPPIWPDALHADTAKPTRESPKRVGGSGSPFYYEHTTRWSYQYSSIEPLTGKPTYWKG